MYRLLLNKFYQIYHKLNSAVHNNFDIRTDNQYTINKMDSSEKIATIAKAPPNSYP